MKYPFVEWRRTGGRDFASSIARLLRRDPFERVPKSTKFVSLFHRAVI